LVGWITNCQSAPCYLGDQRNFYFRRSRSQTPRVLFNTSRDVISVLSKLHHCSVAARCHCEVIQ